MKKLLIIIIVLLVGYIGYDYLNQNTVSYKENRAILMDTTFITYIDTVVHAVKQTAVFDSRELKNVTEELKARDIDIVKLKRKVNGYKNLVSILQTKVIVKDTIILNSSIKDDTLRVAYKDTLMKMEGLYTFKDSIFNFNYEYTPSITTLQYKKGKDIFVDFSLNDKNANVLSITSIQIKNKKKWYDKGIVKFTIGILVGKIIK